MFPDRRTAFEGGFILLIKLWVVRFVHIRLVLALDAILEYFWSIINCDALSLSLSVWSSFPARHPQFCFLLVLCSSGGFPL
jgi:hypothetical protein